MELSCWENTLLVTLVKHFAREKCPPNPTVAKNVDNKNKNCFKNLKKNLYIILICKQLTPFDSLVGASYCQMKIISFPTCDTRDIHYLRI